jgi:hypothetical protein
VTLGFLAEKGLDVGVGRNQKFGKPRQGKWVQSLFVATQSREFAQALGPDFVMPPFLRRREIVWIHGFD